MPQVQTYHHITSDVGGEKGDGTEILYGYNENKTPSDFYGTVDEYISVLSDVKRLTTLRYLTRNTAGVGQATADDISPDDDDLAALRTKQLTILVASDLTTLKKFGTTVDATRCLQMDKRSGMFNVVEGDYTAHIAADTREGMFLKMTGVDESTAVLRRRTANDYNTGGTFHTDYFDMPDASDSLNVSCDSEFDAMLEIGNLVKPGKIEIGSQRFLFSNAIQDIGWQVEICGTRGFQFPLLLRNYITTDVKRGLFAFSDFGFNLHDLTFICLAGTLSPDVAAGGSLVSQILTQNVSASGRQFIERVYMAPRQANYGLVLDGLSNTLSTGPSDRGIFVNALECFGARTASVLLDGVFHFFASNCEWMPQVASEGTNKVVLKIAGSVGAYNYYINIGQSVLAGEIQLSNLSHSRIEATGIATTTPDSTVNNTVVVLTEQTSNLLGLGHNWDQKSCRYEMGVNYRGAFQAYQNTTLTDQTGDGTAVVLTFNTFVVGQSPSAWALPYSSYYDTSTGKITPPQTGRFRIDITVLLKGLVSGHTDWSLVVQTYTSADAAIAGQKRTFSGLAFAAANASGDLEINANTTLYIDGTAGMYAKATLTVSGGTKVVDINGDSNYRTTLTVTPV